MPTVDSLFDLIYNCMVSGEVKSFFSSLAVNFVPPFINLLPARYIVRLLYIFFKESKLCELQVSCIKKIPAINKINVFKI